MSVNKFKTKFKAKAKTPFSSDRKKSKEDALDIDPNANIPAKARALLGLDALQITPVETQPPPPPVGVVETPAKTDVKVQEVPKPCGVPPGVDVVSETIVEDIEAVVKRVVTTVVNEVCALQPPVVELEQRKLHSPPTWPLVKKDMEVIDAAPTTPVVGMKQTTPNTTSHNASQKPKERFKTAMSERPARVRRRRPKNPSQQMMKLPDKVKSMLVGSDAEMIGKYEVIELVGKGAQGTVRKCLNTENNKIVAIKTMQNRGLGRRWNRKNIEVSREVALLKKVKHPNLVSFIQVLSDEENNCTHLVIEYVDGGPLKEMSDEALLEGRSTPLRETDSRNYFRQLLSALHYLHYHKILHRDIKPSNLLIDRKTGSLKVTDFGIAINSNAEKAARVLGSDDNILAYANVSGTPAFLPPEYHRLVMGESSEEESQKGRKKIWDRLHRTDKKTEKLECEEPPKEEDEEEWQPPVLQYFNGRPADIWAAGVTLYAFTYGRLPFSPTNKRGVKPTVQSLQEQIVNSPLRFPGTGLGVSSRLKNLLSRMLDKNPLTRIQMHELLVDPWVCLCEPMPPLSGAEKHSIEPTAKELSHVFSDIKGMFRNARSEAHRLGHNLRVSMTSMTSTPRTSSVEIDSDES